MPRIPIMKRSVLAAALALVPAAYVPAADLRVLPPKVSLTGPHAVQRLLVVLNDGAETVADRTAQAKFSSSNPPIATVAADGTVRATADGETTITVGANGKRVTVPVKVAKTKEPPVDPFRNEVIPMLTRIGCNSGACHGALAGKGGLKLSLRGYDPEADHFVLTRQALGRRIDLQEPARSLLLRKPTLAPVARRRPETRSRLDRLPACSPTGSPRGAGAASRRTARRSASRSFRQPPCSSRRTGCKCSCGRGTPTAAPGT